MTDITSRKSDRQFLKKTSERLDEIAKERDAFSAEWVHLVDARRLTEFRSSEYESLSDKIEANRAEQERLSNEFSALMDERAPALERQSKRDRVWLAGKLLALVVLYIAVMLILGDVFS